MKTDRVTKALLAMIVLFLGILALKPASNSSRAAEPVAAGNESMRFGRYAFAVNDGAYFFFDRENGNIYAFTAAYDFKNFRIGGYANSFVGRVESFDKPLGKNAAK